MDMKEINGSSTDWELSHWWIRTRYFHFINIVKKMIKTKGNLRVLEIGSGTAPSMKLLKKDVVGSDISCVDIAYDGDFEIEGIKYYSNTYALNSQKYDLLVTMDVLEHVADDKAELIGWLDLLGDNGELFLTVPAHKFLWSKHDEYLDHYRRYTREDIEKLFKACDLELILSSHIFSFLVPLVYLLRVKFPAKKVEIGLKRSGIIFNMIFLSLGLIESIISKFITLPFGSSIVAHGRKKLPSS
jgi:2-polyprenyl-3-methyl-5-hydroxy-6-metoxy-1,4-benzoquinol methylase